MAGPRDIMTKCLALILTILCLAACGLPQTEMPTATPIPPTATPIPPTATPVPPTATPVPPTATPAPPTATLDPPTATPVPPTATPVPPTATPVPPTATPETPSVSLDTQAPGACAHPFYPVRDDVVWTYRTFGQGADPTEYTRVYKDITAEGFSGEIRIGDMVLASAWRCGDQGMIANDYASIAGGALPGVTYETLEVTGVYLLPIDQWALGATWEMAFQVVANITAEDEIVQADMVITQKSEIVAVEEIIVPAGVFAEAYRVDVQNTISLSARGDSKTLEMPMSMWLVRDVGMVREETALGDHITGSELVSVERLEMP